MRYTAAEESPRAFVNQCSARSVKKLATETADRGLLDPAIPSATAVRL